ncbi:MAG: hypothetical protein IKX25_06180 [Bacteroidales bacterium]|nr:hypothetical protein [Bacteroidales bacterium]
MKQLVLLSLSLLAASPLAANNADDTETTASDCSAAYQQFSFDLYTNIENYCTETLGSMNVVVSPLSAWIALGMLQQGANNSTLHGINKVLCLPEDFRGLALYNSQLIDDLLKPCYWDDWENEKAKPVLELANSFWADDAITCLDLYKDTLSLCYSADYSQLDLALPASMDAVDAWVNEKTHGTIPSLKIMPSDELMMLLVNALYFKAGWETPADSTQTTEMPFHTYSGEVKNVPMMYFEGHMNCMEIDGFLVLRLWFGVDHTFSMTFFVPQDDATFDSSIYTQAKQTLDQYYKHIILRLPRFTTDAEIVMNKTLQEMGMSEAFMSGADFSGMSNDALSVSLVKQLTHIAVDEKGVVASAATVIAMENSLEPVPEPEYVTIDRPFYFSIEDNQTDKLLFLGHIIDIEEDSQNPDHLNTIESTCPNVIYDMMGHRQSSLVPGINIVHQSGKSRLVFVK